MLLVAIFPDVKFELLFVQAEVRQSVDADVKKAKADSEIDVKELYYDIYEQVRSFAFSSLARCLFPFNLGLKMALRRNPNRRFSSFMRRSKHYFEFLCCNSYLK